MDEDTHDEASPEKLAKELLVAEKTEPISERHHSVEDNHRGSFITLTEGESSLPEVIISLSSSVFHNELLI